MLRLSIVFLIIAGSISVDCRKSDFLKVLPKTGRPTRLQPCGNGGRMVINSVLAPRYSARMGPSILISTVRNLCTGKTRCSVAMTTLDRVSVAGSCYPQNTAGTTVRKGKCLAAYKKFRIHDELRFKRQADDICAIETTYLMLMGLRQDSIRALDLTPSQMRGSPPQFGSMYIPAVEWLLRPRSYRAHTNPEHVEFELLSRAESEVEGITRVVPTAYLWTEYSPCPDCLDWINNFVRTVRAHSEYFRDFNLIVGFNRWYYANRRTYREMAETRRYRPAEGVAIYHCPVDASGMGAPDRIYPA